MSDAQLFESIANTEEQIFEILKNFLAQNPTLAIDGLELDFDGDEGEGDEIIGVSLIISEKG